MALNDPMGSEFPGWPSNPWAAPADHWVDPEAERDLLRRQLRRHRLGYSLLGLALVVASLSTVGQLILFFSRQRLQVGVILGFQQWDLIEDSVIVIGSLLGVAMLFGGWPDESWRRRSGLLLMMCLVDAVLFAIDHATDLGISDGQFDHLWFRRSLGTALGWSEVALMASLAGDEAARLGEPQAIDFAKAVRSLATTGAMVWFLFFYSRTDWNPPPPLSIWPLRERPWDPNGIMLLLGWWVLSAILLVQVTGLTLMAGRCCGRALREMAAQDKAGDLPPSRSEAGWDELYSRNSRPKDGA